LIKTATAAIDIPRIQGDLTSEYKKGHSYADSDPAKHVRYLLQCFTKS